MDLKSIEVEGLSSILLAVDHLRKEAADNVRINSNTIFSEECSRKYNKLNNTYNVIAKEIMERLDESDEVVSKS